MHDLMGRGTMANEMICEATLRAKCLPIGTGRQSWHSMEQCRHPLSHGADRALHLLQSGDDCDVTGLRVTSLDSI